jgi:hypothetical protein
VVAEAGHSFGDGMSEALAADGVAVLVCCTALGAAVMPNGQSRDDPATIMPA